jgi:hypothetical protein
MSSDVLIYGVNGSNAVPLSVDPTGALNTVGGGGGGGGSAPIQRSFLDSSAGGSVTAVAPAVPGSRFVMTGYYFSASSGSNNDINASIIIRDAPASTPNGTIRIDEDFRGQVTATQSVNRNVQGLNIAADNDEGMGFSLTAPTGAIYNVGIIGYYTANA